MPIIPGEPSVYTGGQPSQMAYAEMIASHDEGYTKRKNAWVQEQLRKKFGDGGVHLKEERDLAEYYDEHAAELEAEAQKLADKKHEAAVTVVQQQKALEATNAGYGTRTANTPMTQQGAGAAGSSNSLLDAYAAPSSPTMSGNGTETSADVLNGWAAVYDIEPAIANVSLTDTNGNAVLIGSFLDNLTRWSTSDVEDLQRRLYLGGYYGPVAPNAIAWGVADNATIRSTTTLLQEAARERVGAEYGADSTLNWSQILDQQIEAQSGNFGYDSQGNIGTMVKTFTQTSPNAARGVLRDAMTSFLGRAPNSQEVRRFQRALNRAEAANPIVKATVAQTDESGDIIGSQTNEFGGVDRGDQEALAEFQMGQSSGEEHNRYQLMNLMGAFERAIGG